MSYPKTGMILAMDVVYFDKVMKEPNASQIKVRSYNSSDKLYHHLHVSHPIKNKEGFSHNSFEIFHLF